MTTRHNAASSEMSDLERRNEASAESLASKLTTLKTLALDMEDEIRDDVSLLDNLGIDMSGGTIRLGGSSKRLRNMGRTRGLTGRRLTCYMALGVLGFMIFVYYFLIPRSL